jgi:integrase
MAREPGKLTALRVARAKASGLHGDGGGLYLQVSPAGRSWIFRYQHAGRRRYMGLGPAAVVSLAEARRKAQEARKALAEGKDPIAARRASEAALAAAAAKSMTFEACAAAYIASHADGWRNAKHAAQWQATLTAYAFPAFGNVPAADIDVAMVLKAVEPIWKQKPETAARVRGRIEAVLDWAAARGFRVGDNPARWRGHLANLLPARAKVRRVTHHPALPYVRMGEFMAALRGQEGIAAKALEFTILTAARTSEATGAAWDEIDLGAATWTIPATRIKASKEHKVPLSTPALAILRAMAGTREGEFVFPGGRRARPLSNAAMAAVLKRMGRDEITTHGFRSAFRDWAAERTNYPREVAEMALAHAVGDKVEAAYRRGDLFEKRALLMKEWAMFCGTVAKAGKAANVVPMRGKR